GARAAGHPIPPCGLRKSENAVISDRSLVATPNTRTLRKLTRQANGDMSRETSSDVTAAPDVTDDAGVTADALRRAEEYVAQEEGAANRLTGWAGIAVTAVAVAMTLFHLYASYDVIATQPLRYTPLAFVLVLTFL